MADDTLETQRLVLRPQTLDDLPFIQRSMNTARVMQFLGGKPRPEEDVANGLTLDIEAFGKGDWRKWMIWRRDGDCRIGVCGLFNMRSKAAPAALQGQTEIGWTLAEDYWGQGFATEAARAVLSYAFDRLALPVVYSQTSDSNGPSTRMMHRLGFSARPELGYHDPDYPDEDNPTTVWSLAAREFACDD